MQRIYQTHRLLLKVLDKAGGDAVLDYFVRNGHFLKPWEPERDREFYTREYQRAQLSSDIKDMESGYLCKLWLFKKEDEQKVIGMIAYNNIVRGASLSCHLGYRLDEGEVNRGYITEAVQKGNEIMFSEFKLHRIEANIMPRNTASLRVTEKLGFTNEGLAKKYLRINGVWEDHIHMVLFNEEM